MSECTDATTSVVVVQSIAVAESVESVAAVTTLETVALADVVQAVTEVVTVEAVSSDAGAPGRAGERGPQGPAGPRGGLYSVVSGEDINAVHVVAVDGDGLAYTASSLNIDDAERVVGVSMFAARAGEAVTIVGGGQVPADLAEPIGPLFLGTAGELTPNHDSGRYQLRIAYAVTPNILAVRIGTPIYT